MNDKLYEVQNSAIQAGFFDKNVFTQKRELLLVLETGIAGLRHRIDKDSRDGKALLKKLKPGTELFCIVTSKMNTTSGRFPFIRKIINNLVTLRASRMKP